MEMLLLIEGVLHAHKIWLSVATATGAIIFSIWQIKINSRLKRLQDYVSIVAVPNSEEGKIKLLNSGKVNLYLWGFDMPGNNRRFQKPRLITAGGGDSAHYWIDSPLNTEQATVFPWEFEFILYLEDEFGKKWISEHGGQVEKTGVDTKGPMRMIVWSYRTYKKRWHIR